MLYPKSTFALLPAVLTTRVWVGSAVGVSISLLCSSAEYTHIQEVYIFKSKCWVLDACI